MYALLSSGENGRPPLAPTLPDVKTEWLRVALTSQKAQFLVGSEVDLKK